MNMSQMIEGGGRSYGKSQMMREAAKKVALACGGTPKEIIDKVSAEALKQEFRNNLPKAYILKAKYDEMSEEQIKSLEAKNEYILVPVEEEEFERLKQSAIPYTMPSELKMPPELPILEPCVRVCRIGSGKTPKLLPKDYAKKRKKKQRIQKQSRKKHK